MSGSCDDRNASAEDTVSNRKAHRRERSFHRAESSTQHRLRRPERSDRYERQIEERRERRSLCGLITQWLAEDAA
jgi:hypothetical protein